MLMEDANMGFVKDAANVATFGAAGQLFGKKKKKLEEIKPTPMVTLTNRPVDRPSSLIGSSRGMF